MSDSIIIDDTETQSSCYLPSVETMNQIPNKLVKTESPLAHIPQQTTKGTVTLSELALMGHIILRGDPNDDVFLSGAKSVLGVDLPTRLKTVYSGHLCISWLTPNEWLVLSPQSETFALEQTFRTKMLGHYAVSDVSGGQTILELSGINAIDVLQKSTPYDVHENNFPINKVVSTTLAKSSATIIRTNKQEWMLIIRRSFADYIWRWLQEAASEFQH